MLAIWQHYQQTRFVADAPLKVNYHPCQSTPRDFSHQDGIESVSFMLVLFLAQSKIMVGDILAPHLKICAVMSTYSPSTCISVLVSSPGHAC